MKRRRRNRPACRRRPTPKPRKREPGNRSAGSRVLRELVAHAADAVADSDLGLRAQTLGDRRTRVARSLDRYRCRRRTCWLDSRSSTPSCMRASTTRTKPMRRRVAKRWAACSTCSRVSNRCRLARICRSRRPSARCATFGLRWRPCRRCRRSRTSTTCLDG